MVGCVVDQTDVDVISILNDVGGGQDQALVINDDAGAAATPGFHRDDPGGGLLEDLGAAQIKGSSHNDGS